LTAKPHQPPFSWFLAPPRSYLRGAR
jgi:hypothetical protein